MLSHLYLVTLFCCFYSVYLGEWFTYIFFLNWCKIGSSFRPCGVQVEVSALNSVNVLMAQIQHQFIDVPGMVSFPVTKYWEE